MTQREALYRMALTFLGTDASPQDLAADAFGCAETVTAIVNKVRPDIQWSNRLSTYYMRKDLMTGKSFDEVDSPLPGDIIISATGYGGKNGIRNGHVGIVMENGMIASNDSRTGLFDINYTMDSWHRYYQLRGGYEIRLFRLRG